MNGEAKTPQLDFSVFLISLASSAQVHLGLVPNPATNKTEKNLPLAKQTIDILEILREKTGGNLTKDEETLFDNLLFELRMRYMEEKNKSEILNPKS